MANLLQIDHLALPNHPHLRSGDVCYYLLEYFPRQKPPFGATNQLILNLKKSVDRRGKQEYFYKGQAIDRAAQLLRSAINPEWLQNVATLVPVPSSKTRGHELYDDRMIQVLRQLTSGFTADVRDLIIQSHDLECFHEGYRLRPEELEQFYHLDETLCREKPQLVAIFDDMLTTGCHFKAAQAVIGRRWSGVPIIGVFLARVVRPSTL